MTPEQAGIAHFSVSHFNKFISSPGLWARQYLGNLRDGGNPKMWCGTAVEDGFVAYLRNGNLQEAYDVALRSFALNSQADSTQAEASAAQAELIIPMINQCLLWTPPSPLSAAQIKVEYWFDDIPVPIIGYVDLAFECGIDVDLKTTTKCPSKPSAAHVRQVSLYRAARNRNPGRLLYVTDKKYAYYPVTDEMMATGLEELHDAARKITKLLSAFDKAEDIIDVLPIDWDHWMAPKRDAQVTAGASEFSAVKLETN